MVDQLWVMYVAVVVTVVIMLVASKPMSFHHQAPLVQGAGTLLPHGVGVALVAEGMGHYLPKGYIYGPMAFAFMVDMLQMRVLRNKQA